MIDCQKARQFLSAYADDELDIATAQELAGHLENCADCRKTLDAIVAVKQAVANPALYYKAPASLRLTLRGGATPKTTWSIPLWPLATAASLLVVVGLGWMFLTGPSVNDADDVLASHLRSLQADHLLDVVSTDQHTVKPWFDGKVDFAPPVHDLASEGYPLVGGRLDYLHGRPVAALVFHRNKHVINLFIWPGDCSVQTESRQGYNLIRFADDGMICWAVSDVNTAELQDFARLFEATTPPAAHTAPATAP